MPQNIQTEMLLVTSDDYWGHAGDFDATVNFYPYSFIITQSQYAAMDDADKGRFFPCALFYYAGETDNHGFQPRRMGCRVEDDDSVSFSRVQGVDRLGNSSIRDYRTGEGTPYSIPGSFSMLQGDGDSYETISAAAEAGSLPTGAFTVTDLLYNQEAVINTINQTAGVETETASAESYAAEEATPSGYDSADPTSYVAAPEASPTGYVDMDNHAEDYFASEGYHTIGDFTQDSAAGSGHGVPEYYGTNSAGPMVFNADMKEIAQDWEDAVSKDVAEMKRLGQPMSRGHVVNTNQKAVYDKYGDKVGTARSVATASKKLMNAEVMYGTDGSVVGQAVGNWDSTPFGFQAEGPEVMWDEDEWVSVRDGTVADTIADEYMDMGEDYDDADDYARRAAKKMSAEGLGDYTGPLTNGFGENSAAVSNYGVPVWYGSAETAYNGMGENSASISGQGVPQWYGSAESEGLPAGVGTDGPDNGFYPNSYGEDSSTSSQGVPQWYGSAETMPVQVQKSETRWAMAVGAAILGALTAWTLSKKAGEETPEEPEEPEE
jgi:hypothetical protein